MSFSLPSVPEAPDEVPLQQEGSSGQNQESVASGQSCSEFAPQTPTLVEELANVEEQEQSQPMDLGSEFIL